MTKYVMHMCKKLGWKSVLLDAKFVFIVAKGESEVDERLREAVDELHDVNTYATEGSDARDKRFRLTS
eukprot:CAMPEP_0170747878 /NCGR_PEP_ID=MMETSP0437-20130122/9556_1 /TAXON_ID=0 /ORGANISM="Sexangularia sp." /LENGTH=67 /DNA_ID=CAMNT_0011086683 /DNA_START=51 /DNA_END=254 /DNA_ORIENTATION=+